MKKAIQFLMVASLLLLFVPTQLHADEETGKSSAKVTITLESTEANALFVRLNEIKAMDIPAMNTSEKKELRKEVRSIKKELKAISKSDSEASAISNSEENKNGGVYISLGAVVIIVLLLILLL